MTLIFKNMNAFFFSIYAAVIKVFKGEELQPNELYSLNENTRYKLNKMQYLILNECVITTLSSYLLSPMQVASEDRYGVLYQRIFSGALVCQSPGVLRLVKQVKNKCITRKRKKHANIASCDYLQNQILTKGLSIILDEIQKHEGETRCGGSAVCVHH